MTPIAVILLVISAAAHAGWNLLSKRRNPSASFFVVASAIGGLTFTPAVVYHMRSPAGFPPQVWGLLGAAGLCVAANYASLAGAYRRGSLSVVYPLARSSPVIVVVAVSLLLGRGDQVSGRCIAGIVLVVAGCFAIPMRRLLDFRLANYLNPSCGLALLAAIGTTGYSIIDDEALRALRAAQGAGDAGSTGAALTYASLEMLFAAGWLSLLILIRPGGRGELWGVLRQDLPYAAAAGVAIICTYVLVLISLEYVRNVSYAVAFRQLSIPLGTLLGIAVLGEAAHLPKLMGTAVMFGGLVLVALG